jgi:hypothetical protein
MKTPESSQAPDLMRMVSWMRLCCEKFLLAMVMARDAVNDNIRRGSRARTMLAHESDQRPIIAPHDVFDRRRVHFRECLLLLDVV